MEDFPVKMDRDEEILRRKALARVEAKIGFYGHLLWYLLVNALLLFMNTATYSGEWWIV